MSTALASTFFVLIFLLLAIPAAASVYRPRLAWGVVPLSIGSLAWLAFYHVGFSFGNFSQAFVQPASLGGAPPAAACERAVQAAIQANLFISRPNLGRVVVQREIWAQLPAQTQEAMLQCLQRMQPMNRRRVPIRVVEQ